MREQAFVMIPQILITEKVNHSVRSVYMAIASFKHNESKQAFPSYNTLVKLLGCSKTTISKAIKKLEELGLISVRREKKEGTNCNKVNVYTFLTKFIEKKKDREDKIRRVLGEEPEKPLSDRIVNIQYGELKPEFRGLTQQQIIEKLREQISKR